MGLEVLGCSQPPRTPNNSRKGSCHHLQVFRCWVRQRPQLLAMPLVSA